MFRFFEFQPLEFKIYKMGIEPETSTLKERRGKSQGVEATPRGSEQTILKVTKRLSFPPLHCREKSTSSEHVYERPKPGTSDKEIVTRNRAEKSLHHKPTIWRST
uniref:Uncharacterized protein n=2 Tax=Rhizophora mucronata TaxID=61149 RepID=A0A2P2J588_RHIMU